MARQVREELLRAVRALFQDRSNDTAECKQVHQVIVESIHNYLPKPAGHSNKHVSLGDVLDNFVKLKDEPRVQEQDKLLVPIEEKIRAHYADGAKGTPDSSAFAEVVAKLHEAYAEALHRRTTKKGRIKEWLHVVREGNESFQKVYNNIWQEVR